MSARSFIIGAPRSGSGKTTLTLGLLAAFRDRGLTVRGVKSGPDYIDPAFHAAATGKAGLNLDTWAMPPDVIDSLMAEAAGDCDLVVVESAMGLFDGVEAPPRRTGAAADLAARFGLPVLLVLDVSGQAQTAAAVAKGFASYDAEVKIGGIVLNRVGSERHISLATRAIEALGIPVLGAIRRDASLTLPERHLGLVQASEHADIDAHLARLSAAIRSQLDLDAILALATPLSSQAITAAKTLRPPGQRIALASDAAFSFIYPHLVAEWRRAGAEIVPFSPLGDEGPRDDCDVCWLPGGYPELHAGTLAAADQFRHRMQAFAATRPVHGECGGHMVLGEMLEDGDGTCNRMLGLLGHSTSYAKRKMSLGYRQATLLADSALATAGTRVRGHEFHYAQITSAGDDAPLVELVDGQGRAMGPAGGKRGLVSGTFFHVIAAE